MKVSSAHQTQAATKVETPKQAPVQAQAKAAETAKAAPSNPAHLGKSIDTTA